MISNPFPNTGFLFAFTYGEADSSSREVNATHRYNDFNEDDNNDDSLYNSTKILTEWVYEER